MGGGSLLRSIFRINLHRLTKEYAMANMEQNPGLSSGYDDVYDDRQSRQRRGESTFKQLSGTVADKLHAAAQTLHQKAARSDQQSDLAQYENRAADWLDRAADYTGNLEPQQLRSDIESQVRRNPGRSLLIAGVAGLLIGRMLRR